MQASLFFMRQENIAEQIIMGVDPGTRVMGYAFLQVRQKQLELLQTGVLTFDAKKNMMLRLKSIYDDVSALVENFHPDVLAIEAPFYGKNVQSMLKLGRAQGIAMAIALHREIPVFEYSPRKVKQAVTGNGNASKEQLAAMLEQILHVRIVTEYFDATDALGIALCHYYESHSMFSSGKHSKDWTDFLEKNKERIL